jgi:hypothetical protein
MAKVYLRFSNPTAEYTNIDHWSKSLNLHLVEVFGKQTVVSFDKVWEDISLAYSLTYKPSSDWDNINKCVLAEWNGHRENLIMFKDIFMEDDQIRQVFDHLRTQGWTIEFDTHMNEND